MAKKRRLITRRRAKWVGTILTICLLTILVSSAWYVIVYNYNDVRTRASFAVSYGRVYIGRTRYSEDRPSDWPSGFLFVWKNEAGLFWRPDWKTRRIPADSYMRTHVYIPLWLPLLLIAAPTAWLWYTDRRAKPWQCAKCRYDLRGIEGGGGGEGGKWGGVCPECGTPTTR